MLLSGICFQGYGQSKEFTLDELKEIAGYLNEVDYLRLENSLLMSKVQLKDGIISSQKNIISMYEAKDENWKNMVEDMKIPWYQKPVFVMASTAVVVGGIFFLIK